ncbi:MAG: sensor histidine kinase [Frankiales bacterium]|nr:sensor histidine kinase [Frankiales bacterium]
MHPQAGRLLGRWYAWSSDPVPSVDGSAAVPAYQRVGERLRAHPVVVDALVAVAVGLCAVPQLLFWARQPSGGLGVRIVLTVLLVAPLAWRRRLPLTTFALAAGVALVQWTLGITLAADVALLVYLGTVASAYRLRVAVPAALVIELGVVLAVARWDFPTALALPLLPTLLLLSAPVVAALVLGVSVRSRRQALTALRERAAQLELNQEQQATMAVAAERVRIAREMHDVVAHSLAVVVTLSDAAAAKVARDPDRAAAAMRQVSATGHEALDEMRGVLGVLRGGARPADRQPQPGLDQLEALVAQVRATGLDASLELSGAPADLPPGLALTVHRIAQEATTNTLNHAGSATRVDVRVEVAEDLVRVDVRDNGRGPGATSPGGLGLLGMRERAAVHGGTLQAGPDPSGGWSVRAVIPVSAPRAGATEAPLGAAR